MKKRMKIQPFFVRKRSKDAMEINFLKKIRKSDEKGFLEKKE